jgi:hypothetical protein
MSRKFIHQECGGAKFLRDFPINNYFLKTTMHDDLVSLPRILCRVVRAILEQYWVLIMVAMIKIQRHKLRIFRKLNGGYLPQNFINILHVHGKLLKPPSESFLYLEFSVSAVSHMDLMTSSRETLALERIAF